MLGRIFLCSVKATGIVAFLLVVFDIFVTGILLDLASTLLSANPSAGMFVGFHVVYIIIGLLIATAAGAIIGLVWALFSTSSSVQSKTRATVVWLFFLTLIALIYISKSSVEIDLSDLDLEEIQVKEVAPEMLEVSGRLKNNLYGVSRVEAVEYQSSTGVFYIVVLVYAKSADGARRPPVFDLQIDIPSHVKRVFVGGVYGEKLVWGSPEEEPSVE